MRFDSIFIVNIFVFYSEYFQFIIAAYIHWIIFYFFSAFFFPFNKFLIKFFPKLLILYFYVIFFFFLNFYFFIFSTFFFHILYFLSFVREFLMRKRSSWRNIKSLNTYWRLLQGLVFFSICVILFLIVSFICKQFYYQIHIFFFFILLSDTRILFFYNFHFLTIIIMKFIVESIYHPFFLYFIYLLLIFSLNYQLKYLVKWLLIFLFSYFLFFLPIYNSLLISSSFFCRISFISLNGTKVWKMHYTMQSTLNLPSNLLRASVHTTVNVQKI